MTDGLTFEEGVQLAIKTLRQTPHTRLNMTPFQIHYGRKPRTAITNLIGQPQCLLSDWKKTLTNYISAQPSELQVFTINDSEEEMADYLILNDSRKRARSVSPDFKQYQFFEKENKPNAMKCNFEANKVLTAIGESGLIITTSEGKIVHNKLASNPIKFQLSKRPNEQGKPTSRCRRCGKFSQGEYCDTHKRVFGMKGMPQETNHSHTLPMMPQEEPKNCDLETDNTDEEDSDTQTTPYDEEIVPGGGETSAPGEIQTATEQAAADKTPSLPTTPIGCSTSLGPRQVQSIPDKDSTPIRATTTFDQETTKDKEKGKSKSTGQTEKRKS